MTSFSGIQTFMKWNYSRVIEKNNDVVILGAPWDGSTSNRPGARFGPSAIRKVSHWFDAEKDPQFPFGIMMSDLNSIDYGDVEIGRDYHDTMANIENTADIIFSADQNLITMGGDHSITLPLLRSAYKKYGKISLIHFDAHADTWEDDSPSTAHGSFMRTVVKEGLIDTDHSIQIGIRTCAPKMKELPNPIYCPIRFTVDSLATKIINTVNTITPIPSNTIMTNRPVYITFDIDSLDPAFAPGTGTPVSGGLQISMVLELLTQLQNLNLIGLDVVEVSPPYDYSDLTSVAASTIINYYLQLLIIKKNHDHQELLDALSRKI